MKLNLGCGEDIREGYENVDIINEKDIIYMDLNYGLRYRNDSINEIQCHHTLEHLDNPNKFMLELYRVCEDKAEIHLSVPHFSFFGTYADLTHKYNGFSYFTFGNENWNKELYPKFKVESYLNFTRTRFLWLNWFINPIINLMPTFYERFLCYVLPCSEIQFKLEVKK